MDAKSGQKEIQYPSDDNYFRSNIINLHKQGSRNNEICKLLDLTRGQVAGVIWRYKNSGIQQKVKK